MKYSFMKGLLAGSLIATATLVILWQTKKLVPLTEDLKRSLKVLTKQVKRKLLDFEDISKDKFDEIVGNIVTSYAKTTDMNRDDKSALIHALQINRE